MAATSNKVMFQRYDCVLAVEGPCSQEILRAMLGGYKDKPLPDPPFSLDLALIAKRSGPVHVFNGKAHLRQRFLGVYRANGMISEEEVNRLRESGEYQVDYCGRLSVVPSDAYLDLGVPFELRLTGRGEKEIIEGDVILVEERGADDPPCTDFTLTFSSMNDPANAPIDPETELGRSLLSLDSRQMRRALNELRAKPLQERGTGQAEPPA